MKTQAFISGKWVSTPEVFMVLNPADDTIVAQVADCSDELTHLAIDSATEALKSWKCLPAKARSAYLLRIQQLLMRDQKEIAAILTTENGKPIKEAEGEVAFSASFFEWFAGEGRRNYGDVIPATLPGKQLITLREPIGVAALITPWNFPIGMLARKVAAALAAGCTCVVKPSEDTPLTSLKFAQICEEAELPTGVVNIITCSRDRAQRTGEILCSSPKVSVLSFTGSTVVGQKLYQQCGVTLKRIAMELGGCAPFIVFNSADIDLVIQGLMASKFRNTGQTCVTANRILIQEKVFDVVVKRLAEAMDRELKVGSGLEPTNTQGPLINARQFKRLENIVKDAIDKGASVVRGGKPHALGGQFFEPTLLVNVTSDMLVYSEEIFGPVAALVSFSDEQHALRLANDCDRGLAGYFYSSELQQTWRVARALEVGMVGINDVLISTCEAPFGGVKTSGFGKEGSRHGLDEFTNTKLLSFSSSY